MTQFVTFVIIAVVVYVYLVFPLLVLVRGWLWHRPWIRAEITPTVDVVIVCHNEAAHIEAKLRNVFESCYPADRLHVIVASDGSDDGTDEIVRRFPDERMTLVACPRRGKIPALNEAVAAARSEVLVFSDANSQLSSDSIQNLVRNFADERVGCVAGNQVYTKDVTAGATSSGEHSYWNFDRLLKWAESRAGNTISATGAIYAIRRALFQAVPSGVTDDFTISTRTILQGYRIVFEPDAIAREPVAGEPRGEYRRKVRVMTRGLRGVWGVRALLNPFRFGFYSIQLFSHKVLRRLVAVPLLALLLLVPWLWNEGGWLRALAVAQLAFYTLALAGWVFSKTRLGRCRPVAIPFYFCLVNVAALMAATNIVTGRKIDRWQPQRGADEKPTIRASAMG